MQRARDFSELKEIPEEMRERLREVYDHVDDIDLYVGGLAETHVEGYCSTRFFEYSGINRIILKLTFTLAGGLGEDHGRSNQFGNLNHFIDFIFSLLS